MARVNAADKYYRHFYYYWDGAEWSTTQPAVDDTTANIISWNYTSPFNALTYGPGTGDIFYSAHFTTYLCIFQGAGTLSNFYLSYSTTGALTGPWSAPTLLFETDVDPECARWSPGYELNYAGHAYPMWDMSGETVLCGWSACSAWVRMVEVGFV